jgi:hypothetical protein
MLFEVVRKTGFEMLKPKQHAQDSNGLHAPAGQQPLLAFLSVVESSLQSPFSEQHSSLQHVSF